MNNAQKLFEFLQKQYPKTDNLYLTKDLFKVEIAAKQGVCSGNLFMLSERTITVYNEDGRHLYYYRTIHAEAVFSFETAYTKSIFY